MAISAKKQALRKRLKDIWDSEDFYVGVTHGMTDENVDELMDYIDAWEEQKPEDSDLESDIAAAAVFIRRGEGHLLYEEE